MQIPKHRAKMATRIMATTSLRHPFLMISAIPASFIGWLRSASNALCPIPGQVEETDEFEIICVHLRVKAYSSSFFSSPAIGTSAFPKFARAAYREMQARHGVLTLCCIPRQQCFTRLHADQADVKSASPAGSDFPGVPDSLAFAEAAVKEIVASDIRFRPKHSVLASQ